MMVNAATRKSHRSESKVTGEKFQHVNLFDQLVHLRIGLLESGAAERQNESDIAFYKCIYKVFRIAM